MLAAPSSSDDTTFSIPILVGTAALGVGWILLLVAVAPWRRPHGIRSGPATQDLPPVPPAVAGLLCNDFELPAELPPATLLDLAGGTWCALSAGGRSSCPARRQHRAARSRRRSALPVDRAATARP